MPRTLDDFAYKISENLSSRAYGSELKTHCPVCGSRDIFNIWKLPMTRIDPPIEVFGGYFDMVPTLQTPFQVFGFDLCRNCESILLNPEPPREQRIATYVASTSYLKSMTDDAVRARHSARYRELVALAPDGATSLVDAACGYGLNLFLAKEDREHRWSRAVGLELSEAYVRNMCENGIEAYKFDLDRDDHRALIDSGTIDFVTLYEAFEHVERPLGALARLLDMLRVGGRLYFTAQRYGSDVKLAVRPGEPIYIGPKMLDLLPKLLPCRLLNVKATGARYFILLERTDGMIEDSHFQLGKAAGALAADGRPVDAPSRSLPQTPAVVPAEQIDGDWCTFLLARPFQQERGHNYVVHLKKHARSEALNRIADSPQNPRRSSAIVFEDDRPLGPPHSSHAYIRKYGQGCFSHWKDNLYFSSSDGSDPNTNGRTYKVRFLLES